MKYTVIGLYGATTSEDVEADTPESAAENAEHYATLCHQCSKDMSIGDCYDVCVLDDSGNEVLPFEQHSERAAVRAYKQRVLMELREARRNGRGSFNQAIKLIEKLDEK